MPGQLEIVEAQALQLTAEERARLADKLIASLFEDSSPSTSPADKGYSKLVANLLGV